MVDLHSHIIPYIDDGASNIEETIKMIKQAEKQSIKYIVATPHYINNLYETKMQDNLLHTKKLNEMLQEQNIDIKVLLGNEIMLDTNTLELLEEKNIYNK